MAMPEFDAHQETGIIFSPSADWARKTEYTQKACVIFR